jgi:uncharacterized protein (TIGR02186 family)
MTAVMANLWLLTVGMLLAGLLSTPAPASAQSESVAIDTSAKEIAIEPDFSGAEIAIFGAVDNSKQATRTSGYYDIIIVFRGPAETVVTRRKERVGGIWINGESRTFAKVPSFYGVLSNRSITEIANSETLRGFDIEFDPAPLNDETMPTDEFESALLRLKERQGMYVKAPLSVVFLSRSLFRAALKLPAQVLEGTYTAQIYLFHEGKLLSWDTSFLEVRKVGIERYLYTLASAQPWLYGLISVVIAVISGLLGWALFRRS